MFIFLVNSAKMINAVTHQKVIITHFKQTKILYLSMNHQYFASFIKFTISIKITFIYIFCPDSFVNSQEWTLSRTVPDIRLGIVGSLNSGKSALVHRYLTGSYMQEESPEGGRFKKEVQIDNQSYLLLIRDEGGSPELQVYKIDVLQQYFFGNCLLFFFLSFFVQ